MSSSMTSFFVVALCLVFLIGVIIYAIKFEKKTRGKVEDQYGKFATKFGLVFKEGKKGFFGTYNYPQIQGEIGGKKVNIYSYKTGGKHKVIYTDFKITFNGNVPEMRFVENGFIQKISKKFGGQDIVIGNDDLDEFFVFKSNDEALMLKMIDADVQNMLLALKKQVKGGIFIQKNTMRFTILNHIIDDAKREETEKIFVMMMKMANNIEE